MSLTGRLRAGDPVVFGRLYDEHAERLYTYCRAMVGDEAGAALRDAFAAATRAFGPREDGPRIWLYGLVRTECLRRDPPPGQAGSPLGRAAARLRREHREALVLAASLETAELARVLGVAADTAEALLEMARRRLAQAATAALGADAIARLHELVIRPYEPPPELRDQVLIACSAAGRAAAGALLFDDSGMPIAPESLFGSAEAVTGPAADGERRAEGTGENHADGNPPHGQPNTERGIGPRVRERIGPVGARGPARSRQPSGLVLGLVVGAAVTVGLLALWPATGGGRASNVDRTSRLGRSSAPGSSRLGGSLRSVPRPSAPPRTGTPTASPTPARSPTPSRPSTGSPPAPPASPPGLPTQVTVPSLSPHGPPASRGPKSHG